MSKPAVFTAASADGTKLVAMHSNTGGIYRSTDAGATWTQTNAAITSWSSIASSADGSVLVALTYNNAGIYLSTDEGATWTLTSAPSTYWGYPAMSSNGAVIAAIDADYNGGIWISTNGGSTWSQTTAPDATWRATAMSSDGSVLVASNYSDGRIYRSVDTGETWTKTAAPNLYWSSIASSSDGSHLAATLSYNGGIWTSTDSGASWTQGQVPSANWTRVASSADGATIVAVSYNQPMDQPGVGVYVSKNGGATWMAIENTATTSWEAATVSADGRKLFAAGDQGISTSGGGSMILHDGAAIDLIYSGAGTFFVANISGSVTAPRARRVPRRSTSLQKRRSQVAAGFSSARTASTVSDRDPLP